MEAGGWHIVLNLCGDMRKDMLHPDGGVGGLCSHDHGVDCWAIELLEGPDSEAAAWTDTMGDLKAEVVLDEDSKASGHFKGLLGIPAGLAGGRGGINFCGRRRPHGRLGCGPSGQAYAAVPGSLSGLPVFLLGHGCRCFSAIY